MVEPIKPVVHASLNTLLETEAKRRGIDPVRYRDQILLSKRAPSNFSYQRDHNTFEVKFARNSPLNGQSYRDENGVEQVIENASASSGDRTNEHVLSMRGIYRNGRLVCATGRPDTLLRSQELSEFIPFGDTFVVQSLMSPLGITRFTGFNEKASTEAEAKALEHLPHKPFLFVRPINLFSLLEYILPKRFSGRLLAEKISKRTHLEFKKYIYARWSSFSASEQKCIEDCLYFLEKGNLLPEEEILLRDLLCKFVGLPIVYHCKSSTDRTTVATSISCALAGWNRPFPKIGERFAPHLLTQDPDFQKEALEHSKNLLPITLLSRGAEGFSWGQGLASNPTAVRLLPKELTRPTKKGIRFVLATLIYFIALPLNILALPFTEDKWIVFKKIINPYNAWKAFADREIRPESGLLKRS
ncbi:MAG: hypothetical protein KBC64_02580 [Simkaniaceae bacterium]|nr:hypothetical protein [Simkaniaceae bacterium]